MGKVLRGASGRIAVFAEVGAHGGRDYSRRVGEYLEEGESVLIGWKMAMDEGKDGLGRGRVREDGVEDACKTLFVCETVETVAL